MVKNVFFILLCVLLIGYTSPKLNLLFNVNGKYIFYSNKESSNAEFTFCDKAQALQIKKQISRYSGECVKLDYNKDLLQEIIEKYNAKLLKTERVENVTSYYFYTNKIPFYKQIQNDCINLHVAVDGEIMYIASPIIYSGY